MSIFRSHLNSTLLYVSFISTFVLLFKLVLSASSSICKPHFFIALYDNGSPYIHELTKSDQRIAFRKENWCDGKFQSLS